ncbi:hypothetical protein SEMRO_21_G014750.1 [Seminavis robusta]|uniref:Uncharacterized protein n=1 Tax=Seminavis robusta TaxID=568900 RepID=A0A9N8H0I8_9STRA|nr:hypothetical protein SEMRO_21_G014750.1 [Seminavis robusta]|eukprot:Sro21_g014750.1 n/a (163) ;mRNA; f:90271-90759
MRRNYGTWIMTRAFPLLSLDDVMRWDGVTPYSALFLPFGDRGHSAATDVLSKVREVSTEREVRAAVETLAVFVKDIAESQSILDTDHDILEDFDETNGNCNHVSIVRWKALVRHLRQATVDLHDSCLADTYLVAIKAAIEFSAHVGTKLMPDCPKYESDEDV